ncbi:transglutaminase N-terminal domain-containing protein [Brachybacterium sp. Z12]|uniref:transglutaminase N-terminal domain-containing protein n=1 Tax=Brachybacterium sp. Z12 TaxID=2759167 RepID=UPI00223C4927|nr:transglutaminase N-terminal domain-containing protein [Brachybacterium sp. Z12]
MSEHAQSTARPRPLLPLREGGAAASEPVHYRVHHLTSYRYAKPVSRNYGRAHVEPRATPTSACCPMR